MSNGLLFDIIIWVIPTAIALSGWITLFYTWITSNPKIKGRVFNMFSGEMPDPSNSSQTLTAFNVYIYLTNTRKNTAVHILDYELELDTGSGFERMERVYGADTIPNWEFDMQNQTVQIPNYPNQLITSHAKPIEYGVPLHGFILFASRKPHEEFKENIKKVRITCVDSFRGRHKIESCQKQFSPFHLFRELAGMKFSRKKAEP